MQDEIKTSGKRFIGGLCTFDDFHQRHFFHRTEEMQADEFARIRHSLCQPGNRQRRCIRSDDRFGADNLLGGRGNPGLEIAILKHRFDDQIATREIRITFGWGDPRQHLITLQSIHLPTGDFLVQQRRRMCFAFLGGNQIDILKHHFNARRSTDKGNTRAHHPCAKHADLTRDIRRKTLRPRTTSIDLVELKPERANQVFRDLPGGQFGEVTGFDQVRGVEIDLSALDYRAEDFLRRRHCPLGLATQNRRRNRQHLRDFRIRRRTARNLITLHIPALHCRRIGNDPGARLGQQLIAIRRQLINQTRLQRLLRTHFLAFE
ncbi:hypothetical protein D3C87_1014700 [compost metagenome]